MAPSAHDDVGPISQELEKHCAMTGRYPSRGSKLGQAVRRIRKRKWEDTPERRRVEELWKRYPYARATTEEKLQKLIGDHKRFLTSEGAPLFVKNQKARLADPKGAEPRGVIFTSEGSSTLPPASCAIRAASQRGRELTAPKRIIRAHDKDLRHLEADGHDQARSQALARILNKGDGKAAPPWTLTDAAREHLFDLFDIAQETGLMFGRDVVLLRGSALGGRWTGTILAWDWDVDLGIVLNGNLDDFWRDEFGAWVLSFQQYGIELTQRHGFRFPIEVVYPIISDPMAKLALQPG